MTIIQIAPLEDSYHPFQSQSHRTECWLEGYIAVPPALVDAVNDCCGYCELVIENSVLVDVRPVAMPEPEAPEFDPVTDLELLAIDHEFRLTMLELGL